jgi:hypothetical protein
MTTDITQNRWDCAADEVVLEEEEEVEEEDREKDEGERGKNTGYFDTSLPVGKYRLKYLTNTIMVSPGQCKDNRSHTISYKTQNYCS